jgi:coproporphyrinogen III oxidase-like Fe-S oxidoreductase
MILRERFPTSLQFAALPPLALYIHIPWCVRKCPYCDFNSHEARGGIPERQYIDALVADLERVLPLIWGRTVYSVFFGGGTPSLFSPGGIDAILCAVRARLPLVPHAEITLEANPGTFEADKFGAFRAAGVNRLSIGIQSFNPRHLKALGRIHGEAQARRAIEIAVRCFDNVNLDLMYALPEQTVTEALSDIEAAAAYSPAHLSVYHLTIEPNTYFHRYPPRLPDEDDAATMQAEIEGALAARGYVHYEVSAFAKRRGTPLLQAESGDLPVTAQRLAAAAFCRHNLNYWTFGDYLGIGAGAHSKLSFADRVVRQMRYRQPGQYMRAAMGGGAVQTEQEISPREIGFEFMMNALRLVEGFETRLFAERAGLPLAAVAEELGAAERRGLITRDHRRIAPTPLGRRFLNDLLQIFLPEPVDAAGVSTSAFSA